MKSVELWNERIVNYKNAQLQNHFFYQISEEGAILIAVVADAILVYDANAGEMSSKPIRGAHKDVITCIASSKDSKRFATGGLDKSVVIWKYNPNSTPKISAELKYSHSDSVNCIGFNPLTSQIFSGGNLDYALWTPDVSAIEKQKFKEKIICCAWSTDGQNLAFGTINGLIMFSDRKVQEFIEFNKQSPVWCMEWTPITPEFQETSLVVGCWDQTVSTYSSSGQCTGSDKKLTFDPLSINFYPNGEFYAVSGNNNKVTLCTRDGGYLMECCQSKDWIWCTKFRGNTMSLACCTNDGEIFVHQLTQLSVNSLWQERYITRDSLTDVLITNMLSNQKVRIKCRELVRSVSIYRDKVAVMLSERILIYVCVQLEDQNSMKYKLYKKIFKKVQCQNFCLCAANVLVSYQNKLFSYTFNGEIDHQWTFESVIECMVSCGGASKRDLILIGLKNGTVFKVFLDNSFPVQIYKLQVAIKCLDISMNKKKVAIVDDNHNLTVIDLITRDVVFSEMGVDGVSFNCDFEDLIAYSGKGLLFVKCSTFPALNQKIQGNIIGFKAQKLFLLNDHALQTIDIQLTSSMQKYIEKKDFENAYKLSNLGITDQDVRQLGIEALISQQFQISKKCFMKIKDLALIELVNKYENRKLEPAQEIFMIAESLAYQGKFQDAGNFLIKNGLADKAVELFSEMKKWDDAKAFAKKGDVIFRGTSARTGTGRIGTSYGRQQILGQQQMQQQQSQQQQGPASPATDLVQQQQQPKVQLNKILKEQAEWTKETGDWRTAADLFVTCGEYRKAIELYGNNRHLEGLIDVCRQIDKTDNYDNIVLCAQYFRKLKHHGGAKEAYLKMNDIHNLMQLNIEFEFWQEAFQLGRQDKALLELAKLPYAEYLLRSDRYEDSLRAYKAAGRYDITTKMMQEMSANCVEEHRFEDASQYFWQMAMDQLQLIENYMKPSVPDQLRQQKYIEYSEIAEILYAYQKIHNFIEEPFQPLSGEIYMHQIMNVCRFIIQKNINKSLYGVNMSYVYYALAKVSRNLECYKTARLCYDKLGQFKIQNEWNDEIDLSNMLIRSKPFTDQDSLMPVCNRCMSQNNIIGSNKDSCASCYHPMISSFISFNVLPLIEFKIDGKLNHRQVIDIINREKNQQNKQQQQTNSKLKQKQQTLNDGWSESHEDGKQSLKFNQNKIDQNTLFFDKLNEVIEMQHTQSEYIPLIVNESLLQTLQPEEIVFVNMQHICPTIEIKYYKNILPELPLHGCKNCGKFFLLKCPFCKTDEKGNAPQKDIFDI